MPQFDFISNARPSLFAYQPATAPPTTEKIEKVATAVLSTTAKVKAREKTKKDKLNADEMEMVRALVSAYTSRWIFSLDACVRMCMCVCVKNKEIDHAAVLP